MLSRKPTKMPDSHNSYNIVFTSILQSNNLPIANIKALIVLKVLLIVYLLRVDCGSDSWRNKMVGNRECSEEISKWLFNGAKPDRFWLMPRSGEKVGFDRILFSLV